MTICRTEVIITHTVDSEFGDMKGWTHIFPFKSVIRINEYTGIFYFEGRDQHHPFLACSSLGYMCGRWWVLGATLQSRNYYSSFIWEVTEVKEISYTSYDCIILAQRGSIMSV
jgi:hypothetical protein